MKLSVIVCTYNRTDLLVYCLESLLAQSLDQESFELLVVDNADSIETKQLVDKYKVSFNSLRYMVEEKVGLSHARNRGYLEARSDWVVYIDDDAKAHPDCLSRLVNDIKFSQFACIGGRFFPWYLQNKPNWLAEDFGLFPLLKPDFSEIEFNQHVAGGIMAVQKTALATVGGFPAELGMSGTKVGYGEENWMQDQLRKHGYKIGFDPEIKIDHLVASYKWRVSWHLKRMYAKGEMERIMAAAKPDFLKKMLLFTRAMASCCFGLLKNGIRFLLSKPYYWQNYVLDSFSYVYKVAGYISVK